MQEKENIEELFRDAFKNYEEPVKPEIWSKVYEAINAPVTPADPSQGVVGQAATSASTGVAGSFTAYVAGAILLAGSITGIYFMTNQPADQAQPVEPNAVNELVITTEESVNQNQNLQESVVETQEVDESKATSDESGAIIETPAQIREKNNSKQTAFAETANNTNSAVNNQPKADAQVPSKSVASEIEKIKKTVSTTPDPSENVPAAVEPENTEKAPAININPNKLFEPYPTSGIAPLTVKFETADNLDKVEWNFGDGHSSRQTGTFEHTFESPGTYHVVLKYFTADGGMINKQVVIEVKSDLEIPFIPNIFSPNGDGSNDTFTFDASHLADYEVTLFDQSGKKVHSWKKINEGWDGRLNSGKEAKEGTYFYVIFATGDDGHHNTQSGILQLIR